MFQIIDFWYYFGSRILYQMQFPKIFKTALLLQYTNL